jgi:hypothetical protein
MSGWATLATLQPLPANDPWEPLPPRSLLPEFEIASLPYVPRSASPVTPIQSFLPHGQAKRTMIYIHDSLLGAEGVWRTLETRRDQRRREEILSLPSGYQVHGQNSSVYANAYRGLFQEVRGYTYLFLYAKRIKLCSKSRLLSQLFTPFDNCNTPIISPSFISPSDFYCN